MFAGIMIALAAVINLCCPYPVVGAFLFSLGLLSIVYHGARLYTGMTDCWLYELEARQGQCVWAKLGGVLGSLTRLLQVLAVNFIGVCIIACGAMWFIDDAASAVVITKAALPWYQLLWSGAMCGILMLLAVHTYGIAEKYDKPLLGSLLLVMCVMAFILAGFDHSVANMAYVMMSKIQGIDAVKVVFVPVAGNFIGGSLFHMALAVSKMKNGFL